MVKVANQKQSTGIVKDWINKTYRDLVLPIELHTIVAYQLHQQHSVQLLTSPLEVKTRFISDQEKS
jgi:hypothetical protein